MSRNRGHGVEKMGGAEAVCVVMKINFGNEERKTEVKTKTKGIESDTRIGRIDERDVGYRVFLDGPLPCVDESVRRR